jgi:SAM-dependent methyltransferase
VSRALLEEHRRIWAAKPALQTIYRVWFDALLAEAPFRGRALEAGAGPGFFRTYAQATRPDLRFAAADIAATPWEDLVADCLRLPFRSESLDTILALDVIHHLARPGAFFSEAARSLVRGGKVAVVEPWVTPLSYPVYRWLHREGCRLDLDPWDPFAIEETAHKDAFQGDGAVVWHLVRTTPDSTWRRLGFEPPRLELLNGFAYLLSLGFKPKSLLPKSLTRPFLALDRSLRGLAPWLGLRAFVVWERRRQ